MLDGSSSISDGDFTSEKQATEAIMQAFAEVYKSEPDRLHVGVLQFSSHGKFQIEQPLTNKQGEVSASIGNMNKLGGGTSFEAPLRECQRMLAESSKAGTQTFDLCVLVTDGASDESNQELQQMGLLSSATKLMGIYVGSTQQDSDKLRGLTSCTSPSPQPCPFFESAADFELLQNRAKGLASQVTIGLTSEVTETVITHDCNTPLWTLYALALCFPLLVWWCYLHCPRPARPAQAVKKAPQDPKRLATAGANEVRKV
jgi:hypothetical protein